MKHAIKKRFTEEVIHECEVPENINPVFHTLYVLTDAVKSGANLYRANLSGANLYRADLYGANLSGAKLNDLTLIGSRPFFQMGPIGSRNDYLLSFITDQGVYVRAGCFFDTLDEFLDQVNEHHGDSLHGKEYRAAVEIIKMHAELWSPGNSGEGAA